MKDQDIVKLYWDRNEDAIHQTQMKYGAYDADGNEYEINQWSSMYGDPNEEGNITYFYDEFPLLHFTEDEIWLTPHYSHNWEAENLIVITIQ